MICYYIPHLIVSSIHFPISLRTWLKIGSIKTRHIAIYDAVDVVSKD